MCLSKRQLCAERSNANSFLTPCRDVRHLVRSDNTQNISDTCNLAKYAQNTLVFQQDVKLFKLLYVHI